MRTKTRTNTLIYAHSYTHTHTRAHTRINKHTRTHIYIHTLARTHSCIYKYIHITYINIIIILGFFHLQVASSPQNMGSKPTCPEEQSEGIAVKKAKLLAPLKTWVQSQLVQKNSQKELQSKKPDKSD